MLNLRDPRRYRGEAARYREKAATTDNPKLRDSYLGLALQYERLAQVLDRSADLIENAAADVEPRRAAR